VALSKHCSVCLSAQTRSATKARPMAEAGGGAFCLSDQWGMAETCLKTRSLQFCLALEIQT